MRSMPLRSLLFLAVATVSLAVAPAAGKPRPLIAITKAPPAVTQSTMAVFQIKSRAKRTWCRRDSTRYRRCNTGVTYRQLRPGKHTFTLRARSARTFKYLRRQWTVVTAPSPFVPLVPAIDRTGGPGGPQLAPLPGSVSAVTPPPSGTLLFADEFNGTTISPDDWRMYNSPGHAGNGLRRPSAFTERDGNLVVTAQMLDGQIVSGGMAHRREFQYGRFEFRVRTDVDPTSTMSGVVLTWPQKQWAPEFTENDIYETGVATTTRDKFYSYIHFGTANWQQWLEHDADAAQWHTMILDWRPDALEIYRDGELAWRITNVDVIPDNLQHLGIQLDARATRPLTAPVQMFVDYVRIYA